MDNYPELQFSYFLGRVQQFLGLPILLRHFIELDQSSRKSGGILPAIESQVAGVEFFRTKKFLSVCELGFLRMLLYALVRELKPALVVETGILHGLTSMFLLEGLQGSSGRLVSVDLPSYYEEGPSNRDGFDDTLPPACEPGWIVDSERRKQWQVVIGTGVDLLSGLNSESTAIDLFFHDSEHTYGNMYAEMDLAWGCLSVGGVMVVDNIDSTVAFHDFCNNRNVQFLALPSSLDGNMYKPRFGLLRKV